MKLSIDKLVLKAKKIMITSFRRLLVTQYPHFATVESIRLKS